jgi:hypothetical protein
MVCQLDRWTFRFFVEPGEACQESIELINRFICTSELKNSNVWQNDERKGVLENPWNALEESFQDSDFVVLVEEDILVSFDILEYMDRWRKYYKDDPSVLAICASSFWKSGDPDITYLAQDFCPLIWGTWKDRWENVLCDTWDLDYSTGNPDGSESGWDWHIRRRLLPERQMRCAHPQVARALHIGRYGVHMRPEDFLASQAPSFRRCG